MSTTAAHAPALGERLVLSEVQAALAAPQRAEASRLWALSGPEVEAVLGALEQVRATAEAQQVAVMPRPAAGGWACSGASLRWTGPPRPRPR